MPRFRTARERSSLDDPDYQYCRRVVCNIQRLFDEVADETDKYLREQRILDNRIDFFKKRLRSASFNLTFDGVVLLSDAREVVEMLRQLRSLSRGIRGGRISRLAIGSRVLMLINSSINSYRSLKNTRMISDELRRAYQKQEELLVLYKNMITSKNNTLNRQLRELGRPRCRPHFDVAFAGPNLIGDRSLCHGRR